MMVIFRGLVVAAILVGGTEFARAQSQSIGEFLKQQYDCSLAVPMETRGLRSKNREGAILYNPKIDSASGQRAYRWKHEGSLSCVAEGFQNFPGQTGATTRNYSQSTEANVKLKAEIKDILKLVSFEWDYVNKMQADVTDVRGVAPSDEDLVPLITNRLSVDWCKRRVFCGRQKTYVVQSLCEAKIKLKFFLKNTATADIADLLIEALKATLGVNLKYDRRIGQADQWVEVSSDDQLVVVGMNLNGVFEYVDRDVCTR